MKYEDFICGNYSLLLDILNCLKVGVYITDREGNTLFLNDESCKTGGLNRDEVRGKNMKELEKMGFIDSSISLRVLESGKEEEMIQNLGDGDRVYVTGIPLYHGENLDIVVCTEKDITETLTLRELLIKNDKDNAKIREEAEYLKKQNIIMWGNMVAEDEESKRLAKKAMRIAKLDTTVLPYWRVRDGKRSFC